MDRDVRISDIADFFVSYLRNDRLGQIANAHVVHADKRPNGIFSTECLKLAELHSVAVDFAKSGVPAAIPFHLLPKNAEGSYPDFMGKHKKVTYESQTVLGHLYRQCLGASQRGGGNKRFRQDGSSAPIDEIIASVPDDGSFDEEAELLLASWNGHILRLMDQFGVKTEAEVVSGQVLKFAAHHSQLRGRREHFALLMRLNRQTRELRGEYRDIFWHEVGSRRGRLNQSGIQKACAWYKACSRQAARSRKEGETALLSFPWCVSEVLCKLVVAQLAAPN